MRLCYSDELSLYPQTLGCNEIVRKNASDATECLQEEVFVFTNKIAEEEDSICNSYGGAANKNIGDAFLVNWSLDVHSRVETYFNDLRYSLPAGENFADCLLDISMGSIDPEVERLKENQNS